MTMVPEIVSAVSPYTGNVSANTYITALVIAAVIIAGAVIAGIISKKKKK